MSFNNDDSLLAVAERGGERIIILDLRSLKQDCMIGCESGKIIEAICFKPTENILAVSSKDANQSHKIELLDISGAGQVIDTIDDQNIIGHLGNVSSMEFGPDGQVIAILFDQESLFVWDASTRSSVRKKIDFKYIGKGISFFSDSASELIAVCLNQRLCFYNPNEDNFSLVIRCPKIQRILGSKEDKILMVKADGENIGIYEINPSKYWENRWKLFNTLGFENEIGELCYGRLKNIGTIGIVSLTTAGSTAVVAKAPIIVAIPTIIFLPISSMGLFLR